MLPDCSADPLNHDDDTSEPEYNDTDNLDAGVAIDMDMSPNATGRSPLTLTLTMMTWTCRIPGSRSRSRLNLWCKVPILMVPMLLRHHYPLTTSMSKLVLSNVRMSQSLAGQQQVDARPWAPFGSRIDWAVVRWGKLRGSTSTVFSDLLAISGVRNKFRLSYRTSAELNNIIDGSLSRGRPPFEHQKIFNVYFHDVLWCVRALYGDPEFANCLINLPKRHHTDEQKLIRLWHDMHTDEWWWNTQQVLEERQRSATVLPVIISMDKTQTIMFRNKSAYPVYMMLGNILKAIHCKPSRQAYILVGYLPTTCLGHIKVAAEHCRALILAPLKQAGLDGLEVSSGDGMVQRGHPIVASFSGDYPEQCLAVGCKFGECLTCPARPDELGDLAALYKPRDLDVVLSALALADGDATVFTRPCAAAGIKPIFRPFWEELSFVNIYLSITPDILHQLLQGMLKHVVSWIKDVYGPVELDARCRWLPPSHNIRLFLKGITTLSHVSSTEHSQICQILLGLIVDLPLPGGQSPARLVRAVRTILDFLYHSEYPIHSSETVTLLTADLERFHGNKSIFVELGIRDHFNLPKLHNLFGTLDNFNTEHTERLHINFTKDAYRATNRKNKYTQMTIWLERREKILHHKKFVRWRLAGSPSPTLTKHPSAYGVNFAALADRYGAEFFQDVFARFVVAFKNPTVSSRQLEHLADEYIILFQSVSVYHKIKFWNEDVFGRENASDSLDVIHIKPGYINKRGRAIAGQFDTALMNDGTGAHLGVMGYRVGQVRVVFTLSKSTLDYIFPNARLPKYLAYNEWFSNFSNAPQPNHGMYHINRRPEHITSIIPVEKIRRSVHLYPEFGAVAPRDWTSANVLEYCMQFYVSPWSDRHAYVTLA
ncbi:hypothetical protein GGX14DRAFT_534532 [Mycena pura]|uniref:Uncharacterized protein n=1 Tax=Mycena pura TaxID=153505 RepID=A0AAD6VGQ6_9AGAR|nr:hypothetical protein GGX14DRAFT_534532 [Mycena pura]